MLSNLAHLALVIWLVGIPVFVLVFRHLRAPDEDYLLDALAWPLAFAAAPVAYVLRVGYMRAVRRSDVDPAQEDWPITGGTYRLTEEDRRNLAVGSGWLDVPVEELNGVARAHRVWREDNE